jgi:hypothetical protein
MPMTVETRSNTGSKLQTRMQKALYQLDLPLQVLWLPNEKMTIHGEINQQTIFIYDENEKDALATFEHEVYEYKFREVTRLYRAMVNSLLEVLEKEIYARKESFFDFLPLLQEAIKEIQE